MKFNTILLQEKIEQKFIKEALESPNITIGGEFEFYYNSENNYFGTLQTNLEEYYKELDEYFETLYNYTREADYAYNQLQQCY